jgi:hypothetical protein
MNFSARVVHVDQQRKMEVAVPDMPGDRGQQPIFRNVALTFGHAFSKLRNRHAHVGCDRLRTRTQPAGGKIGVVARLP